MMLFLPPCVQFDWTALIGASRYGHHEVVQALLAAGANKEAKDQVGGRGRGIHGKRGAMVSGLCMTTFKNMVLLPPVLLACSMARQPSRGP